MGKVTSDPSNQTPSTTTHFSHPHPLKLINYYGPQQTPGLPSSCSGCKLCPSGLIYSCTACPYFLHKKCFEMPKSISHPCQKDHAFTLLPQPAYGPNALFNCDACGEDGNGFSYHCKICVVDLHILCAAMPLTLNHGSHPHKLNLVYECPYSTKNFSCDICKINGSDHWLYRCSLCGFDAHLKCARGVQPPLMPQQKNNTNNFMGFHSQGPPPPQAAAAATNYRSAPQPRPQQGNFRPHFAAAMPQPNQGGFGVHFPAAAPPRPPPMQQHNFMPTTNNNIPAVGVPTGVAGAGGLNGSQFGINDRTNETLMFLQALQQIIQNNNAATQAMLAGAAAGFGGGVGAGGFGTGGVGGGFGGGNNYMAEFQQLMNRYSGLFDGGGGIPGLNGFGGGIPGLNGFGGGIPGLNGFGGGVGGQDFLQGLMNGGGGGQDILQGLLNGGLGGGGGIDIQSLLSGGGLDFLGGLGGFSF